MSINEDQKQSGSGVSTYLLVPIFLFFVLLIFAVIRSPNLISPAGIGSAIIVIAPLVLATYALTVIVMAGRGSVDLSIGPLIGFVNVGLIQLSSLGVIQSPIAVFLFAMFVGVTYQILMGLIIVYVRVQPIIVSLSGYLSLVGLNLVILPRPGGLAPEWMQSWGAGTSLFSPVLVILAAATAFWYILARTSFWGHLKMMGSDERAAYTSGVQINIVRIGAHAIGGLYAGLAAITFTSLISSGDPSQGSTYTLMAVTALVLGGANLAGGRGGAFGSLLGALNIFLVTYVLATFNFGMLQSFVTDLSFGLMLVFSLLISLFVPELQKRVRGISPMIFFVIMSIPTLGVIINRTKDQATQSNLLRASDYSSYSASGEVATQVTGTAGATFMIVVICIVAVLALLRLVISMRNLSAAALSTVLVIMALGLIFNGDGVDDADAKNANPDVTIIAVSQYITPFFAMEVIPLDKADAISAPVLSNVGMSIVWLTAVVLLSSFIIIMALPRISKRVKHISLWWFAAGLVVLVLLGSFGYHQGSKEPFDLGFGDQHAALVVAVGLFALTGPLVQSQLRDVSQLFIIGLSLLAVAAVFFFADADKAGHDTSHPTYAASVLTYPSLEKPRPAVYGHPSLLDPSDDQSVAPGTQLSFSLLLILLTQYFVGRAMGQTSFQNFWPFCYILISSVFAGAAVFFTVGVAPWKIIVVIMLGVLSSPIVLHIFKTYRQRQGGGGELPGDSVAGYGSLDQGGAA
ncbi:ABC transporter permease [Paracoccaceae bacterium]|nr:ABC transporter permease [Paracoccaceae bacterium]